ncbi:hypothetical protein [Nocardia sp. Marseille-Q1738]
MTSPTSVRARTVLFPGAPHEVGVDQLEGRLQQRGVERLALRRAPGAAAVLRSAALHEVAEAVDGLLEVDLGSVAVAGWRCYDKLRSAAMRTRAGGVEQVTLFEHEINQTYRPRLDVTVDGNPVGELALELCVAMLLEPLAATVRDGMLVALGPGDCTVTVSICVPEVGPIMEGKRTLHAATMIDLRLPIPLVDCVPAPPPALPVSGVPGPRPPQANH